MAGVRQHGWRAIPAVCSEYGADTLPDRYRSGRQVPAFPATSRNPAPCCELEGKRPPGQRNHPVIGVVTKADLRMEQNILVKVGYVGSWSAQRVSKPVQLQINGVIELFALLQLEEEGCCYFDRFSGDENDDGDIQIRITMSEGCWQPSLNKTGILPLPFSFRP